MESTTAGGEVRGSGIVSYGSRLARFRVTGGQIKNFHEKTTFSA
jgi:hypothetical protein